MESIDFTCKLVGGRRVLSGVSHFVLSCNTRLVRLHQVYNVTVTPHRYYYILADCTGRRYGMATDLTLFPAATIEMRFSIRFSKFSLASSD